MDLQITRWIREQDENGAVSLARTLCMAEAGRHGLPVDTVSFSGRVKAQDQGIDGRTRFPVDLDTLVPRGPHVWQIKSGGTTPSASAEFDAEKHAALVEAIEGGADYVLFWTNDPTDQIRSNVRESFSTKVQEVRADAKTVVLFADEIERLCYIHLAVLAQVGPVPISGLTGLDVWARHFELIEYQADDARTETIESIRQHVVREGEPVEVHVFGDTGVGKSRLVHEALSQDGVRERVLVATDPAIWDHGLLTIIAGKPESSLILVVDDCDADDRRALTRLVGMSLGRVRLVTIGSRASRERPAEDRRRLEVLPLAIEASQKIALSTGLGEAEARVVAGLTEGYPGLASTLAKAIAYGSSETTLLARIRGDEDIGLVLATLVDESEVQLLGLLALFERIGFDGDLAPELTLACEAFGVDEAAVRSVAERELQRFVSTAGRFRRVTPRLFAVWLASRFLEIRAGSIANELEQLPESLRERIVEQMREFAGDPVVSRTLGALLEQTPFTSGAVAGVDDSAARLIHVASLVNPAAAMDTIERILQGVTTDQLLLARDGRRGLVRSLEVLLWFDDFFERAATAALRLALAENETWSNNATGAVQGIYRVYLGGTSANYERRVQWTQRSLDTFGTEAIPIIAPGLALAFDDHEFRSATDFGGRTAPSEWRPSTLAEEVAARRSAWNLLVDLAHREAEPSDQVEQALAQCIRTALRRGLSSDVLATLPTVEWTPRGRAKIIQSLNHARSYDELDRLLDEDIARLTSSLAGLDLEERATYVLASSVGELTDDRDELMSGRPRILLDLVEDVARAGWGAWLRLAELTLEGDPDTASRLFDELARLAPSAEFERELEGLQPTPVPALVGYVRGLVAASQMDPVTVLEKWLEQDHLRGAIVQAVHLLPASDALAGLAIDAADRDSSQAYQLGRFLYGAWTRTLGADAAASILERIAQVVVKGLADGDARSALHTLEQALGIADQWTEANPVPQRDTPFRVTLDKLLQVAEGASSGNSSMLDLHVAHIINRLDLDASEKLAMLMRRFRALQSFPSEYDLEQLDHLTASDPELSSDAVVELLRLSADGQFHPWSMWLEDAKILSRVEGATGAELVIDLVTRTCPRGTWPSLMGHIAFDTDAPDPLLVALLGKSDDKELRGRSTFRFMHPRSTSWGPESENLRRRRELAIQWQDLAGLPALFVTWLGELVEVLDDSIAQAELREAEER